VTNSGVDICTGEILSEMTSTPPAGFNIKRTYGLDTKARRASSEILVYGVLE